MRLGNAAPVQQLIFAIALLSTSSFSTTVLACGGFFCQLTPINQAAEQIVFRQDGNQITAMVLIQYEGDAAEFSWVVPVPSTPETNVGSNQFFTDLDRTTRPQFILEQNGRQCEADDIIAFPTSVAESDGADDGGGNGVIVESVQEVGGYEVTVISGDDAQSVTQWLIDNEYDLTPRGRELLAPYVEDNMKFVAVKLQEGRGLGSIQPLIMKYQSDKPVVPIRLTAVAAVENMGVQVWLLGDSRAVPENYLHVIPNYTRLDWFTGFGANSYASYQSLITEAMNEAGGRGFATDYAGRFDNLQDSLSSTEDLQSRLSQLSGRSDSDFLAEVRNFFFDLRVTEAIEEALPLSDQGQTTDLLWDSNFLIQNFTSEQLSAARTAVESAIRDDVIEPLQNSLDVLQGNRYMTRLYTTLSADEMTVDPAFVFNSDMPDQPLQRRATLDMKCIDNETSWTLTLGAGTERDGEVVIDTVGPVPFATPLPVDTQDASFRLETTAKSGLPDVRTVRSFDVASLSADGSWLNTESGSSGGGGAFAPTGLVLTLCPILVGLRRRSRHWRKC